MSVVKDVRLLPDAERPCLARRQVGRQLRERDRWPRARPAASAAARTALCARAGASCVPKRAGMTRTRSPTTLKPASTGSVVFAAIIGSSFSVRAARSRETR